MWDFLKPSATATPSVNISGYAGRTEKLHAILEMAVPRPGGGFAILSHFVVRDPAERRALVHVAHGADLHRRSAGLSGVLR